jgi:hypothetical protein
MVKGKFAIIKDLAVIRPGTVLPEGAVVPSLTIWEGNPGQLNHSCRAVAHNRPTSGYTAGNIPGNHGSTV